MSDAHNEHESVIKTPKQLIAAVVAAFVIPILIIVLLVQYIASNPQVGAGSDGQTEEAIAARIAPIADAGFTLRDANAPKQLLSGVEVYKANCAACHDTGAAGAPKTGDNAGWASRIAKGFNTLVKNAIGGIGAMPPKGGNADLDDIEVARAVAYMANQSGGKFEEPTAPAAQAQAPAPDATAAATTANVTNEERNPAGGAPMASATAPLTSSPPTQTQALEKLIPGPNNQQTASGEVGKKIFESACAACHTTGAAGAPKIGDKGEWAKRLQKGVDTLHANAIKGIGAMPPKGGASASDAEVKAAVEYMLAQSK
jgi:cytochrome c5